MSEASPKKKAELPISKGYQVHGVMRRTSTFNTDRLDHIYVDPHEEKVPLHVHYGDLANAARLRHLLEHIQPDEVYNLAAQSHVRVSFDQAEYGILFNHESPRRGETFVTRKITRALGRIKLGLQEKLYLGNLDARRDWGHAADYVRAMWMMLQHDTPGDFVVATGGNYSVREFLELAASYAGVDWKACVEQDERHFRPTEVDALQGDASKAGRVLGWRPEIGFEKLVRSMVEHDLELAQQELTLLRAGHRVAPRGGAYP